METEKLEKVKKLKDEFRNEKIVVNIANTLLILGIILSVVLILVGFDQYRHGYSWYLVAGGIVLTLCSLCVWGILIMLSNISTTLKNPKQ